MSGTEFNMTDENVWKLLSLASPAKIKAIWVYERNRIVIDYQTMMYRRTALGSFIGFVLGVCVGLFSYWINTRG